MKRLGINHIRLIRKFINNNKNPTISECEKFLSSYVSISTSRKIIADLLYLNFVKKKVSDSDKRVKHLIFKEVNINQLLDGNW